MHSNPPASDQVYQLLAHGRWFSPASSTAKTGRHDIIEILLKVALSIKNQIKSYIYALSLYIQWSKRKGWNHIVRFNPVTFVCLFQVGHEFSMPYVEVYFVFSELRWEVIIGFVDIGDWDFWPSLFKLSFHELQVFLFQL